MFFMLTKCGPQAYTKYECILMFSFILHYM